MAKVRCSCVLTATEPVLIFCVLVERTRASWFVLGYMYHWNKERNEWQDPHSSCLATFRKFKKLNDKETIILKTVFHIDIRTLKITFNVTLYNPWRIHAAHFYEHMYIYLWRASDSSSSILSFCIVSKHCISSIKWLIHSFYLQESDKSQNNQTATKQATKETTGKTLKWAYKSNLWYNLSSSY